MRLDVTGRGRAVEDPPEVHQGLGVQETALLGVRLAGEELDLLLHQLAGRAAVDPEAAADGVERRALAPHLECRRAHAGARLTADRGLIPHCHRRSPFVAEFPCVAL